jgi:hypothetical protein
MLNSFLHNLSQLITPAMNDTTRNSGSDSSDRLIDSTSSASSVAESNANRNHEQREVILKLVMSWLAVFLVLIAAVGAFGYLIFVGISQDVWLMLAREQFPLVVGLPGSAAIALFVVLVLRISSGPINIEFGKMKFEGAAAPIVFWLFCFLALSSMVKILWIS